MSSALYRLAHAIAVAEGFYGINKNAIPKRTHNPGNLKLPPSMSPLGYDAGHTIFASDAAGWGALFRQLQLIVDGNSHVYRLDMTLNQMAQAWAEDWQPWVANVSEQLGISPNTTLKDILIAKEGD